MVATITSFSVSAANSTTANMAGYIAQAMATFTNNVTLIQNYTSTYPNYVVHKITNPLTPGIYNSVYSVFSIASNGNITQTLYETWNSSTLTGTNASTSSAGLSPSGNSLTFYMLTDATNSYGLFNIYISSAINQTFGYIRISPFSYFSANICQSIIGPNETYGCLMISRNIADTLRAAYNTPSLVAGNYYGYSSGASGLSPTGLFIINKPVVVSNFGNIPIGTLSTDLGLLNYTTNSTGSYGSYYTVSANEQYTGTGNRTTPRLVVQVPYTSGSVNSVTINYPTLNIQPAYLGQTGYNMANLIRTNTTGQLWPTGVK